MVPSEVQDRRATNGADADNSVDANQLIDQSTNDTNHAENSVTHIELFAAVEESVISCRPLVDFFYHFDKSTNKYDCDLDMSDNDDDAFSDNGEKKKQKRKKIGRGKHAPCVTVTDRRVAICTLLKSVKFNKSRARRLFAGMIPLLKKILEEESYFPAETHQSDGQDSTDRRNGNDSDGDNGDEDGDSGEERNSRANDEQMNEESASQSVLYLRCCAYLVEAYLHGLIERTTHKRKSRNKYLINTTIDSENESNLQTAIPIIDEAYQVAEILHSTLFPLHRLSTADPPSKTSKQSKQTLSSIFAMCETYWHGRFEDREQFVTQLIPLLLIKCLDVTAQKADVKRLYSIRDALNLLDFDDEESIASLKLHLLRTVSSPLFLQSAEGRKFISHLFQLHSSFVNDLHQAVKVQLPCVKRSILKAYAEIYFTAWKASCDSRNDSEEDDRDDIQTAIEENALQDIMHAGIHAAVPNTAKAARSLLDQFYTKKKTPVVESMLHRLYGPLLWRALSSSNARVRVQASVMLVDTFPLRDPDAGREATEVCVKKSVAALASLLEDDIPSVRVAGATAASKILSSFWVAIPSKDIQSLLNLIIAKHASDATSSNVRASAVIAMQTLLEEEKTHAVLRPLLPSLGNLIHDKTEKVRLAVVKLLLYVKKIRGMKYYHVVPARHLLVRLEDEGYQGNPTGPVSAALTDLLSNSFFPLSNGKRKAVTMTDIINRTLRLLTDNPGAALVFYRNASSKLSVASICKLIAALMNCLVMFIEEEKEHRLEKFCSDDNNTSTSLLDVVPEEDAKRLKHTNASLFKEANNVALMATIAESVSILWDSIKSELSKSQNESCNELLKEIFSGNVLTEVYDHFASKFENEEDFEDSKLGDCFRACVAILHCAGNLDEPKIEGLRTQIVKNLASLKSIPEEKRSKMNFSPSVSLLCVWGMTENVAHCLGSSIVLYFEGEGREQDVEFCQQSNESKKRKSLVKVKASGKSTQLLPQLDMDVCLGILGRILKGSFSASVSARERILRSEIAYSAIENALAKAQIAAENILKARGPKVNVDMIRKIGISLECYGRFVLHKEAMKKDIPLGMPSELHALLDWISDVIVPYLVKLTGQDSTLRDLDLSMISGTGSLCSPLPSGPPKRKMNRDSSPFDPRLSNDSFISAEASFNFYQEKSVFSSSKATAITAINSVLSTYAEWISIRFLYDSTSATKVSKWCQIFKTSDMTVKRSLLPMFLRLSLITMKYGGNLDLFNEIIQSIKDVDLTFAEEEMLDLFTSSLASLRDDKLLSEVIESTYSIVCSIGSRVADNDKDQDIDLWHAVGPCIRSLFMSLLRDGRSSLILAQFMTENPNSGSESMYSGKSVRFHVLKKLKELSPQMPSMTKILAKLNAENDEHEDTMDAGTSGFIENENNDWTE